MGAQKKPGTPESLTSKKSVSPVPGHGWAGTEMGPMGGGEGDASLCLSPLDGPCHLAQTPLVRCCLGAAGLGRAVPVWPGLRPLAGSAGSRCSARACPGHAGCPTYPVIWDLSRMPGASQARPPSQSDAVQGAGHFPGQDCIFSSKCCPLFCPLAARGGDGCLVAVMGHHTVPQPGLSASLGSGTCVCCLCVSCKGHLSCLCLLCQPCQGCGVRSGGCQHPWVQSGLGTPWAQSWVVPGTPVLLQCCPDAWPSICL